MATLPSRAGLTEGVRRRSTEQAINLGGRSRYDGHISALQVYGLHRTHARRRHYAHGLMKQPSLRSKAYLLPSKPVADLFTTESQSHSCTKLLVSR